MPADLRETKVLVSGGAGFIGSHTVDVLLRAGADVVVVDNLSTGRRENLDALSELSNLKQNDLGYSFASFCTCGRQVLSTS